MGAMRADFYPKPVAADHTAIAPWVDGCLLPGVICTAYVLLRLPLRIEKLPHLCEGDASGLREARSVVCDVVCPGSMVV